jgi:hypothetical protein
VVWAYKIDDRSVGNVNPKGSLFCVTVAGSDFPWRDMARLSDLHIDLGVEVYPEYN